MTVLQIVGNQSGAGKTSLAAALVIKANTANKKAVYYKPLSEPDGADPDVEFIENLLTSINAPNISDSSSVNILSSPQAVSYTHLTLPTKA